MTKAPRRILAFATAVAMLPALAAADPIAERLDRITDTVMTWVPALAVLGIFGAGAAYLTGTEGSKRVAGRVIIGIVIMASARQIYTWFAAS